MTKTKDNRAYNRERKAQSELIKRDFKRDKWLEASFEAAYRRIQEQIDRFYLTYAKDKGLSLAEAKKAVKSFDVVSYQKAAKQAVKDKDFSPATNRRLKLYNLKMRISRYELLKADVSKELLLLQGRVADYLEDERRKELVLEHKRQAGILAPQASLSQGFLAILGADFYGVSFSERIWGKNGLYAHLNQELEQSLKRIFTDMMGYKKERNRLARLFETSKSNAQRLLKTEISRINADVDRRFFKKHGFTHAVVVTEPGACQICQAHEGKEVPVSEIEKGVNFYPFHPNCRCSAYGKIVEDEAQDMDLMGKQASFTVGDTIRVSAKKLSGTDFDFWVQDKSKKIRDTVTNVQGAFEGLDGYQKPRVVFLKKSRLAGYAGYDHKQDVLFISDMLHSEKAFRETLSDNYFAAKTIKDTLIHELTHKQHWDSVKSFYKSNKKRYTNLKEAKQALEADLFSYVNRQLQQDALYIAREVSENANSAFNRDNINELIADVMVKKNRISDEVLQEKVEEVLAYGHHDTTEQRNA